MLPEKEKKMAAWAPFVILMMLLLTSWVSHDIYEATIPFATLIAFVALGLTFLRYKNPIACLKERDVDFYVMAAADVIALVNLFLIHSGKGAVLIVVDICLVLYLSDKAAVNGAKIYILTIAGLVFFLYWTFSIRWYFNTNMGGLVLVTCYLLIMLLTQWLKQTEKKALLWVLWAVFAAGGYRIVFYYYSPLIDIPERVAAFTAVAVGTFAVLLWGQLTHRLTMGFMWCVQLMATAAAVMSISYYLSRCALIGVIVFVFLALMPEKVWKNGFLYKLLCVLATAGAVAFSVLYVWMGTLREKFQLTFLYKDILSGREEVWSELWDAFAKQPLTGIGSSYEVKVEWMEGLLEVHNGVLDLLLIHGILVFLLIFYLLLKRLFAMQERAAATGVSRFAASAVFAMMFTAFFENYFIVPPFSLILLFFFAVMNAEWQKKHK